ncbi:unnamed protein product, partial [Musa acuminata subsp. burmannicoides]
MSAAWIQPSYFSADIMLPKKKKKKNKKEEKKCVGNSGSVEGWKLTVITAAYSRKGNIAAAKRQRYCFVVCRESRCLFTIRSGT